MDLSVSPEVSRLPKRFPIGTTYVIEGRGGENGSFRVLSRFVMLPGGRRITLGGDFRGPASLRLRGADSSAGNGPGRRPAKNRPGRAKKIMAGRGTAGRRRR